MENKYYSIKIHSKNFVEIGTRIHNDLVGNKDYIDSNVILNIEYQDTVIILVIPPVNVPDIVIPTSSLAESKDDPFILEINTPSHDEAVRLFEFIDDQIPEEDPMSYGGTIMFNHIADDDLGFSLHITGPVSIPDIIIPMSNLVEIPE